MNVPLPKYMYIVNTLNTSNCTIRRHITRPRSRSL